MSASNKIALAALILSFLSLVVAITAIVMSTRTSHKTTDQLTLPRVKAILNYEQNRNYEACAAIFTVEIINTSKTTGVLGLTASLHVEHLFSDTARRKRYGRMP